MHLHTLRRRVASCRCCHFPAFEWGHNWILRKRGYLGHLLRCPSNHITCMAVQFRMSVKHARPGPWAHLLRWGCQQLNWLDISSPIEDFARDRSLWHRTGQQIVAGSIYQHPFVQECQLSQRRDALRVSTE